MLNKRDLIRSRTPTDNERRYQLGKISNKVDKVEGKGLSTNDFTNTYKNAINDVTKDSHHHSNLGALDLITMADISNWNKKYNEQVMYNLFEGSNASDITLSNDITDYDVLIIMYGNSTNFDTKILMVEETTKQFCLSLDVNSTTNYKEWYTLDTNTITKETTNDKIYIYKVVGLQFAKGVEQSGSNR